MSLTLRKSISSICKDNWASKAELYELDELGEWFS